MILRWGVPCPIASPVVDLKKSLCLLYHVPHALKRQRGGEGDGLYERARAMEAAKYAVERVVAQEGRGGERRSPRLVDDGEREG